MNIKWFKNKSRDEKERFKKLALSQLEVFETLRDILEEELAASLKDAARKDHYVLSAWSEYQADKLGEQRTYRKVIDLLPKEDK
jgi:hypothetical protein